MSGRIAGGHQAWRIVLVVVVFFGPIVVAAILGYGLEEPVTDTIVALVACAIVGFLVDWRRRRRARGNTDATLEHEDSSC